MPSLQDIIREIKNAGESSLVPLKNVRTERDKEELRQKGYRPGYTFEEWQKAWPEIDGNFVYYSGGYSADTVYYTGTLYMAMHLYGRELVFPTHPKEGESERDAFVRAFLRAKRSLENDLAQKKYISVLMPAGDAIQAEMLQNFYKQDGPSPELYDAFISIYVSGDCSTLFYQPGIWPILKACKSPEQIERTNKNIREYAKNGLVEVWRGWCNETTPPDKAASWAPDISSAAFFAVRIHTSSPKLTHGFVAVEDILECLSPEDSRTREPEVIIMPGSIRKGYTTQNLYSSISGGDGASLLESINEIYMAYRDLATKLYGGNKSVEHGLTHTCRVLLNALAIGKAKALDRRKLIRLAEAAVFHDIGRGRDESANEAHGAASARIYRESCVADPIVEFLITAHCLDGNAIDDAAKTLTGKEKDAAIKLLCVLKDADALDRMRFGFSFSSSSGLDVRYLHFKESIMLMPVAFASISGLQPNMDLPEIYRETSVEDIVYSLRIYFQKH